MGLIVYDLKDLYANTFGGKPYKINDGDEFNFNRTGDIVTNKGHLLAIDSNSQYLGVEIWLPVTFFGLNSSIFGVTEILLPHSVIKISSKKNIVKTPLAERTGTVKEQYSVDDYQISIKGFVIDEKERKWPEDGISILKQLYEYNDAIYLDNALTNLFLGSSSNEEGINQRVVIESIDFPEVEGGRKHIRPFSMTLTSDTVFTLELEE